MKLGQPLIGYMALLAFMDLQAVALPLLTRGEETTTRVGETQSAKREARDVDWESLTKTANSLIYEWR